MLGYAELLGHLAVPSLFHGQPVLHEGVREVLACGWRWRSVDFMASSRAHASPHLGIRVCRSIWASRNGCGFGNGETFLNAWVLHIIRLLHTV
jgi:hypothetical protein